MQGFGLFCDCGLVCLVRVPWLGGCLWAITLCGILSDLVLFPGCLCCFVVWILDLLCTFVVRAVLVCDFLSILFAKAA